MANVIRYFSTAGAGAADGTTWADRAPLFTAGNWSSIITGHDFAADALTCYIGPGDYACAQSLNNTTITTDPTYANPLRLVAYDPATSSAWVPPLNWNPAKGDFDTTGMPVIATTTNVATIGTLVCNCYGLKMTATARSAAISSASLHEWCHLENSFSGTGTQAQTNGITVSCVLKCTGTSYDAVNISSFCMGCRIAGDLAASSGNRAGLTTTSSMQAYGNFVSVAGIGMLSTSTSASAIARLSGNTIVNCGSDGIKCGTGWSGATSYFANNCVTGCGGYAINGNGITGESFSIAHNRFRDNNGGGTGLNIGGFTNTPEIASYTVDTTDALEYADPSALDYRIKSTATINGMGFGCGDQAPVGGGGGSYVFIS